MNNSVDAAVLVPVYRAGDGHVRLVVVRRNEDIVHGGQLAFPGGKKEPRDRSLQETALRETQEEVGLAPDAVEVLERLPVVDTVTTGFRITPYLGRIVRPDVWKRAEKEISEVLDVRLDVFTRPGAHGEETRHFDELPKPVRIRFYRVGRYKLWGATYRILHPLLPRLVAGEWEV
jgi:8-oxo-dGTP pyrophosphatase MutT (NUDIX family)